MCKKRIFIYIQIILALLKISSNTLQALQDFITKVILMHQVLILHSYSLKNIKINL